MILGAPSDLCKFIWKEVSGSINEMAAVDFLNFCKANIVQKGVVEQDRREDSRELAELVVTCLSPSDFKMKKNEAVHYSRFLAKAIYYLKMHLLNLTVFSKIMFSKKRSNLSKNLLPVSMASGI